MGRSPCRCRASGQPRRVEQVKNRIMQAGRMLAGTFVVSSAAISGFILSGGTAHAATGAPNITSFVAETLWCGQVFNADSELAFGGKLDAPAPLVMRLGTDPGWPQLPENAVTVEIDGQKVALHNNEFMVGAQSVVKMRIQHLPTGQPVQFEARWTEGLAFANIGTGWSNEQDCSFTNNPRP
jgi:hypothetical protein